MTFARKMLFAALALGLPILVAADSAESHADAQAQLKKLRLVEPEQYARLQHNLAVFGQLSPPRQEALRNLDKDLQDEPTGMRGRLDRTLERYVDWLERLPEADRKQVVQAPDRKARLERIRAIRERQWLERLPKAQAEKLRQAPPEQRPGLIKQLRREDTEQRLDWLIAQRNWDMTRGSSNLPTRLDSLPPEMREYFERSLRPLLSRDEEKLLLDAQDKWPRFPRLFVDLIDSHPLSLLGPIGPTHLRELQLPPIVEKADPKIFKRLREAEGKWPDFGVAVNELSELPLTKKLLRPLASEYTPSRPEQFSVMVQRFIEKKLMPALDEDELRRLRKAEGHWPAYPRTVVELAREHNLQLPTGPQRFDYWDRYRWRAAESATGPGRRRDFFWQ